MTQQQRLAAVHAEVEDFEAGTGYGLPGAAPAAAAAAAYEMTGGGIDTIVKVVELVQRSGIPIGPAVLPAGYGVAAAPAPVHAARFDPSGALLAVAAGRAVGIWAAADWRPARHLVGHTAEVLSVEWDAQGARLVSGSKDKSVRVWDAEGGECTAELLGHTDWVQSAAFDATGRRVASAGWDGVAKVWDLEQRRCVLDIQPAGGQPAGGPRAVRSVSFDPAGGTLLGATEGGVRVWDAGTGVPLRTLRSPGTQSMWGMRRDSAVVAQAAFSGDGRRVASAGWDNAARVWDSASERGTWGQLVVLRGHTAAVHSVAWEPPPRRGGQAGRAGVVPFVRLMGERLGCSAGRRVATGSDDGKVRVWDADTGACLRTYAGHRGAVLSAAFSPSCAGCVASGSTDGTVRVWGAGWTVAAHHSFGADGRRRIAVLLWALKQRQLA